MRKEVVVLGMVALSACSGGGPQTVGSNAAPAGAGVSTGTSTGTTPASTHSFVKPTETKTYTASAAVQTFNYSYVEGVSYTKSPVLNAAGQPVLDDAGFPTTAVDLNSRKLNYDYQTEELYTSNAGTTRSPGVTVTYDPRNAQYTVAIAQNGVSDNITFQDPAHRTDFSNSRTPQLGVPNLELPGQASDRTKGVQYLQVDSGSTATTYDVSTFFYEQPGTSTQYVTYAGFVRNHFDAGEESTISETRTRLDTEIKRKTALERAAFLFGEKSDISAVPKIGSANFTGNMIASMVNNPTLDDPRVSSSYFQWLSGTAAVSVDFAASTVSATLRGTTLAPMRDPSPILSPTNTAGYVYDSVAIPAGASFAATGAGRIDLVGTGGFTGTFSDARFTNGAATQVVAIAGSTLDGAFYGPKAQEIGATFRIVGGIPDQRVDIVGSFTGK